MVNWAETRFGVALAGIALWLLAVPGVARGYLTDDGIYPPINYYVFVPPAVGQSYLDPTFGTPVRRLSNAMVTLNAADDGNLPGISHEYATMSPFNLDNSRLLIQHHSYFALYDGAGSYIKDLPFEVSTATEPRWSRTDPSIFYYLVDNELKRYNVLTDTATVVRRFSEYERVIGAGESDISVDGDHMVLVGDNREIFVYTLSADVKGPALDSSGTGDFDNVFITPENNVIVGWYQIGTARHTGVELYDQNMNFLRQLTTVVAHMDVARDMDGEEILLWHNSPDPDPPPGCENAVVKIRLSDGSRDCMISIPWGQAVHISAADEGNNFVVSTYMPSDPAPVPSPVGNWGKYANEILVVAIDGSEVRRLAHHRSRPFNDYTYTPRAASSRDGGRIVFSSNYGLQEILGYPLDYSDVYMIEVPTSPATSTGSTRRPSIRYQESDVLPGFSGKWFTSTYARHSGGSAMLAAGSGDRMEFSFDGTGVTWIGYQDEWSGIALVYVDGVFYKQVDTYSVEEKAQSELITVRNLESGPHTLTIEAVGVSNPAAGGSWIWVDAIDVIDSVEDDDPLVSYTGDWHGLAHELPTGGHISTSMQSGAATDFDFDGSAVSWIGYRDRWSGIANVYVDGVFRAAIDTYSPNDQLQSRIYTVSGLEAGRHSLTIEVSGNRNPKSEGLWIWIDAFEIPP